MKTGREALLEQLEANKNNPISNGQLLLEFYRNNPSEPLDDFFYKSLLPHTIPYILLFIEATGSDHWKALKDLSAFDNIISTYDNKDLLPDILATIINKVVDKQVANKSFSKEEVGILLDSISKTNVDSLNVDILKYFDLKHGEIRSIALELVSNEAFAKKLGLAALRDDNYKTRISACDKADFAFSYYIYKGITLGRHELFTKEVIDIHEVLRQYGVYTSSMALIDCVTQIMALNGLDKSDKDCLIDALIAKALVVEFRNKLLENLENSAESLKTINNLSLKLLVFKVLIEEYKPEYDDILLQVLGDADVLYSLHTEYERKKLVKDAVVGGKKLEYYIFKGLIGGISNLSMNEQISLAKAFIEYVPDINEYSIEILEAILKVSSGLDKDKVIELKKELESKKELSEVKPIVPNNPPQSPLDTAYQLLLESSHTKDMSASYQSIQCKVQGLEQDIKAISAAVDSGLLAKLLRKKAAHGAEGKVDITEEQLNNLLLLDFKTLVCIYEEVIIKKPEEEALNWFYAVFKWILDCIKSLYYGPQDKELEALANSLGKILNYKGLKKDDINDGLDVKYKSNIEEMAKSILRSIPQQGQDKEKS